MHLPPNLTIAAHPGGQALSEEREGLGAAHGFSGEWDMPAPPSIVEIGSPSLSKQVETK